MLRPDSPFFSPGWLAALADAYGYRPLLFCLRQGGECRAALPAMEVASRLTGRRGIALPFTDRFEPACASQEDFDLLWNAFVAEGRCRRWRYAELRGGERFLSGQPSSSAFLAHSLDLSAGEDRLWRGLAGSTRRGVRKARQSGVSVAQADSLQELRAFYALLGRTRRRHGLPPQPWRFFKALHRRVLANGGGRLLLASVSGRAVAGALFLETERRAVYKFGASERRSQALRPNNLLMWEAIRLLAKEGRESLDFGRTSLGNEGLRRFKLGWGAAEAACHYYRFDLARHRFAAASDRETGWHNHLFRALPLSLSRLAGRLLYKHIA